MALSVAVAVGDDVADLMISKLSEAMASSKIWGIFRKRNDFGPVITAQHKAKVVGYINSAEEQGATIVVDGRDAAPVGYEKGILCGSHANRSSDS